MTEREPAASEAQPTAVDEPAPDPRPPILIVDDEPQILKSLRSLMRTEFVVHTAATGDEALAVMAREPIQVVLSDQRMPGLSGVELLATAQRLHPDVVRLLFTGYADINTVVDGINRGHVYRYIAKPWDSDQLIDVLRAACARHQHIVERRRLLHDLRRSHAQHVALFTALREGKFGALSKLGRREATRLAANGRALLDSLDALLLAAEQRSVD